MSLFSDENWSPLTGGWTHDEAKRHSLVERLYERCAVYAQDFLPCPEQGDDLPQRDWCERCIAAHLLTGFSEASR